MTDSKPEAFFSMIGPPQPVGKYEIGHRIYVMFYKKPTWFYRKMTRLLLGWKWTDGQ